MNSIIMLLLYKVSVYEDYGLWFFKNISEG